MQSPISDCPVAPRPKTRTHEWRLPLVRDDVTVQGPFRGSRLRLRSDRATFSESLVPQCFVLLKRRIEFGGRAVHESDSQCEPAECQKCRHVLIVVIGITIDGCRVWWVQQNSHDFLLARVCTKRLEKSFPDGKRHKRIANSYRWMVIHEADFDEPLVFFRGLRMYLP